jgi:ABC-type transport system involved in cytochrome c biogenesis permease component
MPLPRGTSRLARLLVSDTKSLRVKKTVQATFVIKSRVIGLILGVCLILPCLVPLVLQSVKTIIKATIKRKIATHVMILYKYKPLNQEDAL